MGAQGTLAGGLLDLPGLLVRLGRGLAEALMGQGARWAWMRDAFAWLCVVAGAIAGARGHMLYDMHAAWIAAGAAAALALLLGRTGVRPVTKP
jgi:uncharacterized membrane protein YoaK (UPF0700 family)